MPYFVSLDTYHAVRDYEDCTVIRRLGEDETAIDEVMYEIEFLDGYHIDCFIEELWDGGIQWK